MSNTLENFNYNDKWNIVVMDLERVPPCRLSLRQGGFSLTE